MTTKAACDRVSFRYWIPADKQMFYCNGIDFFRSFSYTPPDNIDDIIIMPSTGQYDRAGRLVYQSDILKNGHGDLTFVDRHESCGCCDTIVGFPEVSSTHHDDCPEYYDYIIGNIYENPELYLGHKEEIDSRSGQDLAMNLTCNVPFAFEVHGGGGWGGGGKDDIGNIPGKVIIYGETTKEKKDFE